MQSEVDSNIDRDTSEEITLETVKSRSVKGVVTLTGRYFILYGITFVAQIFLGIFLSQGEYGVYGIVSAAVNFLVYFSDIGLAASLIQRREKLEEKDLRTTFTIQQILVISLIVLLFICSPRISSFYHLSKEAMWLMYALAFSLFMSSLKTIPTVLLERKIQFEKIAISNILENLFYNVILVFLAWKGFGVTSFTIAVLARGIVGLVSMYILEPWRPGFALSITSLKKLLKFGVPYQANTLIALLKDDGIVLTLGKVMGLDALGLLQWAQKWAQFPLRIFMDTVTKVTFPAFARMQDEKDHLGQSVTRSIFFICFFVFPSIVGLLILAPLLVRIIPRYEKWIPALLPLTLVSVNTAFAAVTTQLTNVFNSIGKIKITSGLMIMWTVLTWVFVPFMANRYGINGAALGYAIVGASSTVAIIIAKRYIKFSLVQSALKPILASISMAAVLLVLRNLLPVNLYSVWILSAVGVAVYFVSILILVGYSIVDDAKKSFKTLTSK